MLRGALIGLGNVALHGHLPGWRRRHDVEIVGGTDSRPEQRAVLMAHAPGARWYATAGELLTEASLDFVDICTPPASHAPLIRSVLERGLHVLCEKPLVGALDDLAPLARLAAKTGRVLYTVHNWHHAPIVRRTTELLREGRIGRVNHVVWHTLRTRPAAVGDQRGGNWRGGTPRPRGGGLNAPGRAGVFVGFRGGGRPPLFVGAPLWPRRGAWWGARG